jgi:hypothetical protein
MGYVQQANGGLMRALTNLRQGRCQRSALQTVLGRGRTLEVGMISLEDCIALCGLTKEEVLTIAEHEHVPDIVAAAMARCLLKEPHGPEQIRDMMRDDIHDALSRGDKEHASELLMVLRHFLDTHPEAQQSRMPMDRHTHT